MKIFYFASIGVVLFLFIYFLFGKNVFVGKEALGFYLGSGVIYASSTMNALIFRFAKKSIASAVFAVVLKFILILISCWVLFSLYGVLDYEVLNIKWFVCGVCFSILTLCLFFKPKSLRKFYGTF